MNLDISHPDALNSLDDITQNEDEPILYLEDLIETILDIEEIDHLKVETILDKEDKEDLNQLKVETILDKEDKEDLNQLSKPEISDTISELDHLNLLNNVKTILNISEVDHANSLSRPEIISDPNLLKLKSLHERELLGDQRSSDWLMQRNNYITASTSAACAGLMGKVARTNMLKEKVSFGRDKTFFGNAFTKKGNVFEPVTNMIYSYKTSKTIHAFALIPSDHPDWSFMGASTDGVTNVLDNIEIKTLARRAIGKVKREYHHQMQHQMFCLGLETTDFIEAKYDEYSTFEEWNDAKEGSTLSGIIVEIKKGEYVYSPIEEPDPVRWAREFDGGCIYWVMTDYQCVTVKRDPTWIVTMGPLLKSFWEEVLYLRTHQEEFEKLNKNINLVQCLV